MDGLCVACEDSLEGDRHTNGYYLPVYNDGPSVLVFAHRECYDELTASEKAFLAAGVAWAMITSDVDLDPEEPIVFYIFDHPDQGYGVAVMVESEFRPNPGTPF